MLTTVKGCNVNASGEILNFPIQVFEIYLQKDDFFPGEVISGKLLVLTERKLETEGIYLKFEGKGGAKWEIREAHLCGIREAEHVDGRRIYFNNMFHYDESTIPEGSTALPFEFELPTRIPPTIVSGAIMKHLKISYKIEAIIRTSEADFRQSKHFTVKGLLNLNRYPELCLPICKSKRELILESFWSSSKNFINFTFNIPKQGFVPGEAFVAELVLKSPARHWDEELQKKMLSNVEVCLIQEIELRFGRNTKLRRRIIGRHDTIRVATVIRKKKRHLEKKLSFELVIPEDALISYEIRGMKDDFIQIRYFVRVVMEQTHFPYKLSKIQLPIKIGTVCIPEKKSIPILLLSSVPLALPKPSSLVPELVTENGDVDKDYLHEITLSAAVALLSSEIKGKSEESEQVFTK